MSNTAIANAYRSALRQNAFERSEIYTDPDSSYWHSLFLGLAGKLFNNLGREAYDAWFDAAFPADDGVAYTWQAKYTAVEAALKAQVQP